MKFASALSVPAEWSAGVKQGVLLGAAVLALTLPPAGLATSRVAAGRPHVAHLAPDIADLAVPRVADFGDHVASYDARFVANWVAHSRDNQHLPFVILDKRDARVFVFDAGGMLVDSSPVLLGAAAGDDSVAGIGNRPIAQVRPEERTTPAGRFVSHPGRNASGEDVVWVDYDAAVSMHRVRPVDPKERRLERLASNDPTQRRISYGCINVPVAFFESVVKPVLGGQRAVVYVLPETRNVRAVFAGAYPVEPNTHRM
jgi:hypothetical protein